MKFTLEIDCGSAAFAPVHDDAGEAERYAAAAAEVQRILWHRELSGLLSERSGFLRDSNGNRCGQWSLSDDGEG